MEGYKVEDYKKMVEDLRRQLVNRDTREGIAMTGHLEVVRYPWNQEKGTWEYDNPDYRTPMGGNHNITTHAGCDATFVQVYGTAVATNNAKYIALTTDSGAPADTDTTLATEITSSGLARAAGTYAHTNAQNTATVKYTFTATAQFTAVQKSGLFDTASAGNLVHEATFTSTNLLTNDQIVVSWTITNSNVS